MESREQLVQKLRALDSRLEQLAQNQFEPGRSERSRQRQSTLLTAINRVLKETITCETDEDVARTCLAVAEEMTGSKCGFICEVNEAGRFDTIAISNPGWEACRIPKTNAVRMLTNLEIRGIRGRVIKEQRSMIFNDPASHPDWVPPPRGHPRITCFLGVPLKHAGRFFGMLGLANKESGYDAADLESIETLAGSFIEALMRKRADKRLLEYQAKLKAMASQLVMAEERERRRLAIGLQDEIA